MLPTALKPVLLVLCLASAGSAAPQGRREAESFALAQCAVVQLGAAARLYLTRPSEDVAAVDLRTGALLWHTTQAAFPLMARGSRLLALLPPVPSQPGWRLGVLDARSGTVLLRFPAWGTGGSVGEGMGSFTSLDARSAQGRDYVVWRSHWSRVSGVRTLAQPVHRDSGMAEVDLVRGTLTPVSEELPDRSLRFVSDPQGGKQSEPFDVGGVTVVAATEQLGQRLRIVLRRRRGEDTLPDVVVCEPAFNSAGVLVSADRRHVLGACQQSYATDRYRYEVVVHSTITGERVGHAVTQGWPVSAVVSHGRLVYFSPDRVGAADLATGRAVFEQPLRSLAYRGSYPP